MGATKQTWLICLILDEQLTSSSWLWIAYSLQLDKSKKARKIHRRMQARPEVSSGLYHRLSCAHSTEISAFSVTRLSPNFPSAMGCPFTFEPTKS